VSDGGAGRGRGDGGGSERPVVLQLFAEPDRTPLHPARRQAILHPVLRVTVRQQVRGVQAAYRNRLQG